MPTANAASRGYQKIAGAARAFNFDFRGKIVLDIGSSTGGFTKYALDRDAAKVVAVEKGTNQMERPLRFDPRVELHEKTDIFDMIIRGGGEFGFDASEHKPEFPDVIVADVSFLSLTKILEYAKMNLARSNTDFLVMLKPQFEARPDQLTKGVVKNEKLRREIIQNFEFWLKRNDFLIIKKRDNSLKGKTGNQERFYWLKLAKSSLQKQP